VAVQWHATGFPSGPYDPPEEPSRLEMLADEAGINPERVRELLRQEIERQRETSGEPVTAEPPLPE
jgi:hypothetical protein